MPVTHIFFSATSQAPEPSCARVWQETSISPGGDNSRAWNMCILVQMEIDMLLHGKAKHTERGGKLQSVNARHYIEPNIWRALSLALDAACWAFCWPLARSAGRSNGFALLDGVRSLSCQARTRECQIQKIKSANRAWPDPTSTIF